MIDAAAQVSYGVILAVSVCAENWRGGQYIHVADLHSVSACRRRGRSVEKQLTTHVTHLFQRQPETVPYTIF